MKIGQRVSTPHGPGVIEHIEHFSRIDGGTNRYGVRLVASPFSFPVAAYWPKEVQAVVRHQEQTDHSI